MISRRSGMSLLEVMAAMGANAVLAGIAVVALVSLRRADRDVNARLDDRAALARFTEQLRSDVHAAETLTWDEQKRVLRLGRGQDDAIEYRTDKSQWSRYVSGAGAAEAELASTFRLPRLLDIEFDPAEANAGDAVRVRLQRSSSRSNPASRSSDDQFIIQLGRDARLLHE